MDRAKLLEALWANVDAFVAKVGGRYPGALTCHAGCSDCCLGGIGVTEVEAEAIAALVRRLDLDVRTRLHERAGARTDERCAALERDGRCSIYDARPIVCRSHGVPIRFRSSFEDDPSPGRRLPLVDVCPRNFEAIDLDTIASDCVLDQVTLSTALGRIDAVDAEPGQRGRRVDLGGLLFELTAEPEVAASKPDV